MCRFWIQLQNPEIPIYKIYSLYKNNCVLRCCSRISSFLIIINVKAVDNIHIDKEKGCFLSYISTLCPPGAQNICILSIKVSENIQGK